ncbi:hypothetical protein CB1_001616015 [Camelus ferus]|nr:hypothetical protein CB1_001616015 [Camelus ferus]
MRHILHEGERGESSSITEALSEGSNRASGAAPGRGAMLCAGGSVLQLPRTLSWRWLCHCIGDEDAARRSPRWRHLTFTDALVSDKKAKAPGMLFRLSAPPGNSKQRLVLPLSLYLDVVMKWTVNLGEQSEQKADKRQRENSESTAGLTSPTEEGRAHSPAYLPQSLELKEADVMKASNSSSLS